ncbi:uncharacterized protein LOC129409441 isoform X2 [Boleophthalmus pectinirostris]|uniref:uncharacterized protein LOC129409441 isoform X2 n=1 Tax=Boleophthalmus pectinirostris TaxID=150288 RepID=UPI0024318D16|nr:uncharacterized protein LOC129409441 isoform X2 [Boleophthalmus pectinirostris]XP_055011482.1 uncharacterized protein LOC129409441 isoform X2 [Boleophthalmus pectinirostris]XP_055011484.1 uncharacterized protein LOC129409441 isoform X2 [Boleophthalmus pectinirostris]
MRAKLNLRSSVDWDFCTQTGVSSVTKLFHPWKSAVRSDSFHFVRRFNCGLTTEHHPLYGTFCTKLSSCVFEWDQEDVQRLKEAKREEWKCSHSGHVPTEEQLMATVNPGELKKHCRRRTRGVEEMRRMISRLLESVWDLTDTTGLCLVSHDSMRHIWEMQQKQLECFQDPPCWRCNATHMQMYMLEGLSRWNMGGAKEAVAVEGASTLRSFDVRPMSHLNSLSQRVRGCNLVAEFPHLGNLLMSA